MFLRNLGFDAIYSTQFTFDAISLAQLSISPIFQWSSFWPQLSSFPLTEWVIKSILFENIYRVCKKNVHPCDISSGRNSEGMKCLSFQAFIFIQHGVITFSIPKQIKIRNFPFLKLSISICWWTSKILDRTVHQMYKNRSLKKSEPSVRQSSEGLKANERPPGDSDSNKQVQLGMDLLFWICSWDI